MWPNKNQTGYTVVETLMVVSVMGMIFISTSLMIRGQIAKYQYRESMQQLEQNIKNIINNVSNGTFGNPASLGAFDGTSDRMLIGTRFWFCTDNSADAICTGQKYGNKMHIETVVSNLLSAPSYLGDNVKILPGGLKFIGWKWLDSLGGAPAGPGMTEFGTSILFKNNSGDAINNITEGQYGIQFYQRSGYLSTNALTSLQSGNGLILCFEGNSRGSIQLAKSNQGTSIEMNLADNRCTW